MKVLLRNRGFLLLFFGQALSTLGDRALIIAFGIWVKELTGSNAAAGGAFFFVAFPYLFAPFAGVIIDRFPRRLVFIVANVTMAFTLLLTLLVHNSDQVWLLYAVTFCYGVSGIIITPTQAALITSIVDDSELPDANGLLQTVSDGVKLLAPLIGAALFTLVGGHTIAMLDAVTFLAAALCVWRIRTPDEERRVEKSVSLRDEMLAGLRHVFGTPALRNVVIALGTALLVTGFTQTLIFSIVDDGLHRAAAFIGVLSSLQGAGAIAAGLAAGRLSRRVGDVREVMIGIAFIAVSAVLYLAPNVFVVAAGAVVFGAGICWTTVGMITVVQRRSPAEIQGRALTAAMGLVSTPQTISIALGAGLSLVVDYRVMLVLIAVVTGGCAIWLARYSTEAQPEIPAAAPEPKGAGEPNT
ncbi:MFS transporter [Actinomadura alba]|uniref:MFS transporter n=1 Tax=Actinomadura alba TaxID=406431 RepID=A0ABR7LMC9_9ACTN|nr:MFS transporter [Actinomadura alba]MBC6465655.1 MFS transporter [Actinomadura alba]